MKQSDKLTAYYFRAAQQIDTLYLDNQMQKLLYHASQNGIAAFALYVDNGYNGLNFNRPAFSLMQQDMSDGRISKIVATSLDRISRNSLDVLAFADYAVSTGISLETITATMQRWIGTDSYMLHLPRKVVSANDKDLFFSADCCPQSVKRRSPRSHFK